jgi:DNA topoisomerase VI subunit B
MSKAKLQRITFETSRAAEYFDARQLSALTGVAEHDFAHVILKELVDNALDAAEVSGERPTISVDVDSESTDSSELGFLESGLLRIVVTDNGPGIPPETVRKMLNFDTRTSDKAAYRSPTRGAQGNALKTVIGIPYALDGQAEPIVIVGQGVEHKIAPWIDPAGEVRITHEETRKPTSGTSVRLGLFPYTSTGQRVEFDPAHWVRSFAAFNPHATKVNRGHTKGPKCTNPPGRAPRSMSLRTRPLPTGIAQLPSRLSYLAISPPRRRAASATYPLENSSGSLPASAEARRRKRYVRASPPTSSASPTTKTTRER